MNTTEIEARPAPKCFLCGTAGEILYSNLRDRSFGAPGEWNLRRCPKFGCGLIWLDPLPTEEDIGKAYASYYTHAQPAPGASIVRDVVYAVWKSYLRVRFGYTQGVGPAWHDLFSPLALLHPGGRDELDSAAMYLNAPPSPARVLDVGCGSGVLLARMQSLGWEVDGVEVDPGGVAAARARGVRVFEGQLADARFPNDHFDAVHSAHVIEHVHDPDALLRECFRILKPGGKLVFITPNTASRGHKKFGSAWLNLDPPRHLILFNAKTLRAAAEKQGFVVERLDSTVRSAWVYGALSRQIARTGRGEMSELGKPMNLLHGMLFQLGERVRKWFDRDAGDELLLIATKTVAR
ncbi:MAG: class I SAM-dependent methyltransferase [Pedosphaera sp.]|nr:class I SAM-dependent methyltransferase [Pedosphaera sp.]